MMVCFILLVVLIIPVTKSGVVLEQIVSTSNPNIGNVNVTAIKNNNGGTLLNVQFVYYVDISMAVATIIIDVPSDDNDKDFQKQILRSTINLCKVKQGQFMGNFLIKMMLENLDQSADFKMECPFRKGNWSIKNMEMTDKFVPTYIFHSFKFVTTIITKVKASNSKNLVPFYTVKVRGERTFD